MSARLSSRRVVVLSSEATVVRLTVHGTGQMAAASNDPSCDLQLSEHGLGRTDRSFGGALRGVGLGSHRTGGCPLKHPRHDRTPRYPSSSLAGFDSLQERGLESCLNLLMFFRQLSLVLGKGPRPAGRTLSSVHSLSLRQVEKDGSRFSIRAWKFQDVVGRSRRTSTPDD